MRELKRKPLMQFVQNISELEIELDASVNPSHSTDDIGEESWSLYTLCLKKLLILLLTLCGLTSEKTNQGGLWLSGSVHEEAHP